jgi:cyclopropane-fatty-acyl-phospholipid synthase
MLEAVGEAYWPRFFAVLRDRLVEGGIAVLQVITIADSRFQRYRRTPDFIQRHIFPGGMLPSPGALRREIARAGLRLHSVECFGASYERTLSAWRRRFERAWPALAEQGFTPRFRRLWSYYLAYCEAGFRAGAIDVGLYRIVKPCEDAPDR